VNFFFPQFPENNCGFSWPREIFDFPRFLCEPEAAEIFASKKKASSRISSSALIFILICAYSENSALPRNIIIKPDFIVITF
jgi:hypothetical protein